MNEVIQNRMLREFLTLFIAVMFTLSAGLMLKSVHPVPQTFFTWWYEPEGEAWQAQHPEPSASAASAQARAWESAPGPLATMFAGHPVTFLVLFGAGLVLAVCATVWQVRLSALSRGTYLAGVLLIADAALFNTDAFNVLDRRPLSLSLLLAACALASVTALLALGAWRLGPTMMARCSTRSRQPSCPCGWSASMSSV